MKRKIPVVIVTLLLLGLPVLAKTKHPAACKVYFSVFEKDNITQGDRIEWLNKPQANWYKKHGDRGHVAGICYAPKESDVPSGATLYRIQWGESAVNIPLNYTYTTEEQQTSTVNGTVTDSQGNTSHVNGQVTTTQPVQHDVTYNTSRYFAGGWLFVWNPSANNGKGDFKSIGPLKSHNHTGWSSPSASLLKSAVKKIRKREKEQLAR